ncbi:ATP-grasp domain-containing protein [Brevibacillus ginsengisoli]|uniref:ATP-grasp domain-containing protein n=1 Tax=Brevibacillus ginsengisoli TaxID=363854 RepID=UPI003CF671A5
MNILFTSAGRRVKLIHFLQETLAGNGRVVAVDCDQNAPALYAADDHLLVPPIDDPDYLDKLLEICSRFEVGAVLSLIDPELSLLSRHRERFADTGIHLVVSAPDVIDICLDKQATYTFLTAHGLPAVPTRASLEETREALEKEEFSFPLLLKPRKGSASQGIMIVKTYQALEEAMRPEHDLVAQPFLEMEEYGVDAYVDLITQKPISIFTKKKLRMRAGETDRSLAIKDLQFTSLIEQLLHVLKPVGPIDIDCFKVGDNYLISEINPRFGGGYPHAYLCGQNFFRFLLNNLQGQSNDPELGRYQAGSTMLKFDEVRIV